MWFFFIFVCQSIYVSIDRSTPLSPSPPPPPFLLRLLLGLFLSVSPFHSQAITFAKQLHPHRPLLISQWNRPIPKIHRAMFDSVGEMLPFLCTPLPCHADRTGWPANLEPLKRLFFSVRAAYGGGGRGVERVSAEANTAIKFFLKQCWLPAFWKKDPKHTRD